MLECFKKFLLELFLVTSRVHPVLFYIGLILIAADGPSAKGEAPYD
jgi:hypothetical protein